MLTDTAEHRNPRPNTAVPARTNAVQNRTQSNTAEHDRTASALHAGGTRLGKPEET